MKQLNWLWTEILSYVLFGHVEQTYFWNGLPAWLPGAVGVTGGASVFGRLPWLLSSPILPRFLDFAMMIEQTKVVDKSGEMCTKVRIREKWLTGVRSWERGRKWEHDDI